MKKIIKDMLVYTNTSVLLKAGAFFLVPLYTKLLTPNEYGIMSILGAIMAILTAICFLGLDESYKRYFVEVEKDIRARRIMTSTIFKLYLLWAIPFLLVVYLSRKFIFGSLIRDYESIVPYFPITFLIVFLSFFIYILYSSFIFEGKSLFFSLTNIFQFLFDVGLKIIAIAVLGLKLWGVYISQAIIYIFLSVLAFRYFLKYLSFDFDFAEAKKYLSYGTPLISHTLSFTLLSIIDRLILQKYVPLSAVGIYSLGYNLGLGVSFLQKGFRRTFTPLFLRRTKQYVEQNAKTEFYSRFGKKYLIQLITIFMLIHFLYFLWAKEICLILVQNSVFWESYKVIPYVIVGYMFMSLISLTNNILIYEKKTVFISITTIIAASVNIILNLLFIPLWGILGAALATTISFFVRSVLILQKAVKVAKMEIDYFKITMLFVFGIIGICGVYQWDKTSFYFVGPEILVKFFITCTGTYKIWRYIKSLKIDQA